MAPVLASFALKVHIAYKYKGKYGYTDLCGQQGENALKIKEFLVKSLIVENWLAYLKIFSKLLKPGNIQS